ncbi:hypothetical protein BC834DRAFT_897752 [Gloeopeniophorella convolvens]|nr:hypothetical protein BC834DRAFT_897752 [Gloeopeniophorella convolvens]
MLSKPSGEVVIKGFFLTLACLYTYVAYGDAQKPTPSDPSRSEWDICWPLATWYISWHVALCISVISMPSRVFRVYTPDEPPRPDWTRLTIHFIWNLAGVPIAYLKYNPCHIDALKTWNRTKLVLIEGMISLGFVIYVSGPWPHMRT